ADRADAGRTNSAGKSGRAGNRRAERSRTMRYWLSAVVAAATLISAGCATAKQETPPPQFVTLEHDVTIDTSDVQVRSWARDKSVLREPYRHRWYRVTLRGGCVNATWGALGFVTASGSMLDRGGSILTEGQACHIAAVDRIADPPPGSRY